MVVAFSINDLLFNNVSETKYKYKLLLSFALSVQKKEASYIKDVKMQFENEDDQLKNNLQTIHATINTLSLC